MKLYTFLRLVHNVFIDVCRHHVAMVNLKNNTFIYLVQGYAKTTVYINSRTATKIAKKFLSFSAEYYALIHYYLNCMEI